MAALIRITRGAKNGLGLLTEIKYGRPLPL